jgi:hypothetical protein
MTINSLTRDLIASAALALTILTAAGCGSADETDSQQGTHVSDNGSPQRPMTIRAMPTRSIKTAPQPQR